MRKVRHNETVKMLGKKKAPRAVEIKELNNHIPSRAKLLCQHLQFSEKGKHFKNDGVEYSHRNTKHSCDKDTNMKTSRAMSIRKWIVIRDSSF